MSITSEKTTSNLFLGEEFLTTTSNKSRNSVANSFTPNYDQEFKIDLICKKRSYQVRQQQMNYCMGLMQYFSNHEMSAEEILRILCKQFSSDIMAVSDMLEEIADYAYYGIIDASEHEEIIDVLNKIRGHIFMTDNYWEEI